MCCPRQAVTLELCDCSGDAEELPEGQEDLLTTEQIPLCI